VALAGPRVSITVIADYYALVRGHTLVGETCEVPGLGPVPVAMVREWMTDCILNVVVRKGVDVATVAHAGRSIPAALRTAVWARDRECSVPGCHNTAQLEYDHDHPWALSRMTSLGNLHLLCKFHHRQKTYEGYRFVGPPGDQRWVGPERSPPDRSPPDGSGTDGSGSDESDPGRITSEQLMFHLREAVRQTRKP
jgi:hypothetical protein